MEETKGYILWHHQLESTIDIFIDDQDEVLALRKGVNAKQADAFVVLDKFRVDKNRTLAEFIINRPLWCDGYTTIPNTHGAFILYDLLKD